MSDQPQNIDFQEVLGDKPATSETAEVTGEMIMAAINTLENAFLDRISEMEATNLALEGRLALAEKYLAFLLTKNPDFKDWLKGQVADLTVTGLATIGAVIEQNAAAEQKGNGDGEPATGQEAKE